MTLFEFDEKEDDKQVVLSVERPSVLRVTCHSVDQAVEGKVTLMLSKSYFLIAAENNTLSAQLSPGNNYTLSIKRPENAAPGTDVVKSVELAVEPNIAMDNYIQRKAVALNNCAPFTQTGMTIDLLVISYHSYEYSPLDAVTEALDVPPGHAYTYNKIHTIKSDLVRSGDSRVSVTQFKFTVHAPSVVVARVGYQYTLNELHITLAQNNHDGSSAVFHPRRYKNYNELDLVRIVSLSTCALLLISFPRLSELARIHSTFTW